MELVLDASSTSTLVGVARQGALLWTGRPVQPEEHTLRLVPEMLAGLEETATAPSGIELVTVALGPGAFNALRVSVSAAKGFAAGTGAALVGIETLLAEALRCPPAARRVRPVLRASRSGYATAVYAWRDARWQKAEEEQFVDEGTLATLIDVETPLCGEEIVELCERLRQLLRVSLPVVSPVPQSRLQALAAEGWRRYRAGNVPPAASLQPVYLRPPHITVPRDRR